MCSLDWGGGRGEEWVCPLDWGGGRGDSISCLTFVYSTLKIFTTLCTWLLGDEYSIVRATPTTKVGSGHVIVVYNCSS